MITDKEILDWMDKNWPKFLEYSWMGSVRNSMKSAMLASGWQPATQPVNQEVNYPPICNDCCRIHPTGEPCFYTPPENQGDVCREGLKAGDYVIATKYNDGDPKDAWCVGYYKELYNHFGRDRHIVVNKDGQPFRANGFRRVKKISTERGSWIVYHMKEIESSSMSVWHYVECSMENIWPQSLTTKEV